MCWTMWRVEFVSGVHRCGENVSMPSESLACAWKRTFLHPLQAPRHGGIDESDDSDGSVRLVVVVEVEVQAGLQI